MRIEYVFWSGVTHSQRLNVWKKINISYELPHVYYYTTICMFLQVFTVT